MLGQVMLWMVCLLWFLTGGLSLFLVFYFVFFFNFSSFFFLFKQCSFQEILRSRVKMSLKVDTF